MKILVHRKDNIGDLVLSLPCLQAIRNRWPDATLFFWGPSYSTPLLTYFSEDVETMTYEKSRHKTKLREKVLALLLKMSLIIRVWRLRPDLFFYLGDGASDYGRQLQRLVRADRFIGFCQRPELESTAPGNAATLVYSPRTNRRAEYLEVLEILKPFGGADCSCLGKPLLRVPLQRRLGLLERLGCRGESFIGIHLSARRPRQKWPLEYFEELIQSLVLGGSNVPILITWSPGGVSNRDHPGDDGMALELQRRIDRHPLVYFYATQSLDELLVAQSNCKLIFCSDGGAMHTAAALGIRLVAMFGDSDPVRWQPFGDEHLVIQAQHQDVRNFQPPQALEAIQKTLSHGSH